MLEHITDDVFGVRSSIRLAIGLVFPLRATILRLADGALLIHSPVRFSDAEAAEINALGSVRHLVAPNGYHHLYMKAALERWPGATLSKSPALVKKRPDLMPAHILNETEPPWPESEVECLPLEGSPAVGEFLFFHRASKSLLMTDAAFNIAESEHFLSRLWFRMGGTYQVFNQSWVMRLVTKDKAAAARSARKILEWDVQRIIPCHGEVVSVDARAALERAFAGMLRG